VIWGQLQALLWLRWRLLVNHSRRQGALNVVLFVIFRIIIVILVLVTLIIGYLIGNAWLPGEKTDATMLIWDGAVIGYLVFSLLGIMIELQQSAILSLDKLLHLPMTPSRAFLINYLGSSLNLSELVFFAGMLGLALGLMAEMGGAMALLLPLVAAFFLMITSLTYQLRAWLASMMTNPRRRQSMIVIMTMVFLLVFILPSLPGMLQLYRHNASAYNNAPSVTVDVQGRRTGPPDRPQDQRRRPMTPEEKFKLQTRARLASAILPPGWVAYGVVMVLEQRTFSALACLLGMVLIGVWSLWRSYRTTLRLYQGYFVAARGLKKNSATVAAERGLVKPLAGTRSFLELCLPGVPEQACAVATACFRSLLRMPEMKLTLLSPLLMLFMFGGMLGARRVEVTEYLAAIRALGVATFIVFISIMYLLTNQFTYDRSGFRAFVLSPTPRREVLLGKNLAFFPFAAGLMVLAISLSQWLAPLRPDHLAAVSIQMIPIFLMYCMVGNAMSIYLPLVVKPGTAMPVSGQSLKLLLRFLAIMLSLAPLSLFAIPLAIEYLIHFVSGGDGFPVFLPLTIVQTALMAWLYSLVLDKQGEWLGRREQEILVIVTTKAD